MIKSIESLRMLAAIAVLLAHCGDFNIPLVNIFLGNHLFLGSIGVDVFFVISGVVMAHAAKSTQQGLKGAFNFSVTRLLRILPLYAIYTIIFAAALNHRGHPVGAQHFINSIFLIPDIPNQQYIDPIIPIAWTLRFEAFFYALVAAGIALKMPVLAPAIGIISSLMIGSYREFYYSASIMIEFLIGYATYYYLGEQLASWGRGKMCTKVALAIAIAVTLLASLGSDVPADPAHPIETIPRMIIHYGETNINRAIAWGIPAFLLVFAAIMNERSFSWHHKTGKYTYSVYLAQVFTIPIFVKLIPPTSNAMAFSLMLLSTGIMALLSFHLIEQPFINLGRRLRKKIL